MAACSLVSFSPTRTSRASSERSKRKRASCSSKRSASSVIDPSYLDPKPLQDILVPPPVRPHLDHQLEKHLAPEETLDLGPRPGAYLLDHASALADEDPLLGLGLDIEVGAHAAVFDLLDLDLDRMRHLIV